jgi:P4 family phage/plasmid primase-like protien
MYKSNSCDLFRYLYNHKKVETTNNGKKIKLYSNTSIPNNGKGGGSYYINDTEYSEFLKIYSEELERKRFELHITEKFNNISSIVIDLDYRFNGKISNTLIDSPMIKEIVKIHLDYITSHFVSGNNYNNYTCIVLRSQSNPVYDENKNITKDGLHIQFPFIKIDSPYKILMRENLKNKIHEICDKIGNINSINDLYDYSVISGNTQWCLYGSSKPNKKAYSIYKVYKYKNDKIINITDKFNKHYNNKLYRLVLLLSVYKKPKQNTEFKSIEIVKKLQLEDSKLRQNKILKKLQNEQQIFNIDINNSKLENYKIKEITDLISCLNHDRSVNYKFWRKIGVSIHSYSNDLLWLWKEFSKLCPEKYDDEECNKQWESFNKKEYDEKRQQILIKYAKEDNEKKYEELKQHHVFHMIKQICQNINHHDIATILYSMYGKYIICSIDKKIKKWYMFKNQVWQELEPELHLRKFISTQLVKESDNVIKFINSNSNNDNIALINDRLNNNLKLFKNSLKTASFKSSVIKECETVFAKNKFHHKLDNNKYLIALKNGVYNLETHVFRKGVPDDYISLKANVSYDPNCKYNELDDFLNKILPVPELKKFVLKLLAVSLSGIFLQRIFICIGVGSNGKTTLLDLMEQILGSDFYANVHHTLITKGKSNSSGPSPELAKTKGKRLIFMEEPDTRDRLNVGQLKWLTGGGHITARFLQENEIEFSPFYKIFFLVNNEPHIDSTDYGTWRRILCIPFISQFKDNPKSTTKEPYIFKIDRNVKQHFYKWAPAFFNILIQYFKLYQQEGLAPPPIVLNETNKFKTACDYIFAFTHIHIIYTGDDNDYIKFTDIYRIFEIWFKTNRSNKIPQPQEIIKLLEANYFKCAINLNNKFEQGWSGYKFRQIYDEQYSNNNSNNNYNNNSNNNSNNSDKGAELCSVSAKAEISDPDDNSDTDNSDTDNSDTDNSDKGAELCSVSAKTDISDPDDNSQQIYINDDNSQKIYINDDNDIIN